ncbi:hypothetical protein H0H92_010634 [Tricholoma furcatifolium]|nr:hypothetical protein H0H92_010634 [Tricholoma furcatifolium]
MARSHSLARRHSSRHLGSPRRHRHHRTTVNGRRSRSRSLTPTPHTRRNSKDVTDPFIDALLRYNKKGKQGKELSGPLRAYYRAGKLIPRVVDPWLKIDQIFMTALPLEGLMQVERDEPDDEVEDLELKNHQQNLHHAAFKKIIMLAPDMLTKIKMLCRPLPGHKTFNDVLLQNFIDLLSKAAASARTADTHKVSTSICELMLEFSDDCATLPIPFQKPVRGWEHFDTGCLNCPARYYNDYDTDLLAQLKSGGIEVTADDFPAFMYDASLMDDDDILAGLCRGFLLIRTVRHIFFGSGVPRMKKPGTKPTVGEKLGVKVITPEMIAYAACQARHALSSAEEWPNQDMLFVPQDFYYNVLFLFEDIESQWCQETLNFWQQTFFTHNGHTRSKARLTVPPLDPDSNMAKLKALRDQQRRQRQDDLDDFRSDEDEGPSDRGRRNRITSATKRCRRPQIIESEDEDDDAAPGDRRNDGDDHVGDGDTAGSN